MAIQFGTVDGLVNIDEDKIGLFVEGIHAFGTWALVLAQASNQPLGQAFQRFIEPVYKDRSRNFDPQSINVAALTANGNEQSPARATYCRKMGLLAVDEAKGVFELTPIGEAIHTGALNINEYALILMSKMGVFVDNSPQASGNVLYDVLACVKGSKTGTDGLEAYIKAKYNSNELIKTRSDIILNAIITAGLIKNEGKGVFSINPANIDIVEEIIRGGLSFDKAEQDTSASYSDYIGSLEGGIFDIIDENNKDIFVRLYPNIVSIALKNKGIVPDMQPQPVKISTDIPDSFDVQLLSAMRTKPFILLAGISGTGKSREVKKMAFETCHKTNGFADDETSPGNYCLIEVKPNWHDSGELLGYESHIKPRHYALTRFVKFVTKAHLHPEMPFFACLDEMNLAPVEQYFAEFLSVLESRRDTPNGIKSEALIPADIFANPDYEPRLRNELFGYSFAGDAENKLTQAENALYEKLKKDGLRLPSNLVVVGTVNMDETTRQFSRKVIDRAMTIEMNIKSGVEDFTKYFDHPSDTVYREEPWAKRYFTPKYASSSKILEDKELRDFLQKELPQRLAEINDALEGTPFKIAYRVQNELILYFDSLRGLRNGKNNDELLNIAVDDIMMMKILPRVIGDGDMLGQPLDKLWHICEDRYPKSAEKIEDMLRRLAGSDVTSFWP